MYYLLYNDKSNGGKPIKKATKLEKKLSKKYEVKKINIFELIGKEKEFSERLSENDHVVIIGGDGTFHQFFNRISNAVIKCHLYAYASGRGNDFARDYSRKKMFEITHLVNNLPYIKVNDQEEKNFLNGVGMGVDSLVCVEQIKNANMKVKESYFKIALRVLKKFVPYNLDIEVDGTNYHFERVWFFVCNNGRCFGGGMKITPKAVREDDVLDICVVHNIKLFKLLFIFPLVFIGKHAAASKKAVTMLRGKNIKVKPFGCDVLQMDGEVTYGVKELNISR